MVIYCEKAVFLNSEKNARRKNSKVVAFYAELIALFAFLAIFVCLMSINKHSIYFAQAIQKTPSLLLSRRNFF